jgi:hypothetical protein
MGASQSSQPPSRHNSRHGGPPSSDRHGSQHKQPKAASISVSMKTPLPPIKDHPSEASSVPVPAVAVPIPVKKKPVSLPASEENSYVDQSREVDLIHRMDKMGIEVEEDEDEDHETRFGIDWDDFEDDVDRTNRRMCVVDGREG